MVPIGFGKAMDVLVHVTTLYVSQAETHRRSQTTVSYTVTEQ